MKVLVIVKATQASEAGIMPDTELLTAMGKYNDELVKAGLMLDGVGLTPSSRGAGCGSREPRAQSSMARSPKRKS